MKHTKRKIIILMVALMAVACVIIGVAFNFIVNGHVKRKAQNCIDLYLYSEGSVDSTSAIDAQMAGASFLYDPAKDEIPGNEEKKSNYFGHGPQIPDQYEGDMDGYFDDDYNDYGGYYDNDDDDYYGGGWFEDFLNFWGDLFEDDSWSSSDIFWDYYSTGVVNWWEETNPEENTLHKVELDDAVLYVSWRQAEGGKIRFAYVNVTSEMELIKTVSIAIYIIMAVCIGGACLAGFLIGRKIETDQAKQKQFFENASHELKTPLMSIQGYAEGLQEGVVTDTKGATKVILNETDKMTNLVNDILSISRLESGAYKLNKENIDLYSFLAECLTSMEAGINERKLKVVIDVKPQTFIMADRVQFEKAIRNILSNAIRYAKSQIRIYGDVKSLTIWDDGDGISEESLSHLFERFYTGKNGNTGIGMSLTKEIVEQHGWKIKAMNAYDGVQFVINM